MSLIFMNMTLEWVHMTFHTLISLQKNWSVPLRVYPVNVTKSAVSFTKEILIENLNFLCSVNCFRILCKFFGETFRHIWADTALGSFLEKRFQSYNLQMQWKQCFLQIVFKDLVSFLGTANLWNTSFCLRIWPYP